MNKVLVDKARLLRRVIIISWISLALCFVIKIFGGNFFEIMCNNPKYKSLCEYAENHLWLDFILSIVSTLLCQSLYLLAIIQKYKFTTKQFLLTFVSCVFCWFVRIYLPKISIFCDIWLFIVLPLIMLGKNYKKYWHILVAFLLNFLFQLISLLVKNLSIGLVDESIFVVLIYGIDVYIMCFLYYLYRNFIKEQNTMGRFWGLFMGKPVDKLKEMKVKREQQIAKLNEEIKAIETEIAKQSDKK